MRDNFSAQTKRTLASRVGYHCSNPSCRRSTIGPAEERDKAVNIGEAAHITAASAGGGRRFDNSLTPEERRSALNGIWLCGVCHTLIDSDVSRYPAELLQQWKKKAEKRAHIAIATGGDRHLYSSFTPSLDESDREFLQSLALPAKDDFENVTQRMRVAATKDVEAFKRTNDWPLHPLSLSLTIRSGDERHFVTLDGVALAASAAESLSLVSPAGTGKSTTLVQVADRILAAGQTVPVLVPLGEWSSQHMDFFSYLTNRNAFRLFRPQHFMQMAYLGRLVLLLDGWNELDPDSRIRVLHAQQALRRDFPVLGRVIATRNHEPALPDAVVEIQPLAASQQLELGRAMRGNVGEALVDQAWHTPGVRELISIPLYLHAMLHSRPGAEFPKTKEEVLRMFVTQHDQVPEKAELLQKELHGTHTDMLVGLAVEANHRANTMISETDARRVISSVGERLMSDGQLAASPQPDRAIKVLVDCHILTHSTSGSGGISFQHQQFQEWFASYEVERLMRESLQRNSDARQRLRGEVLDRPSWEDAILFACERLSRGDEPERSAVASAIIEALAIDPILAAEMIHRTTNDVWSIVTDTVIRFCGRWHTHGKVDRAVRFMITTGRPEFEQYVWPLVSDADSQIHLHALRAADRFIPTVLGDDLSRKLAALPETVRKNVVPEIASNSGFEGMELAAKLALSDPSADVVVEVIQALAFRRAERHVNQILEGASDEVWQGLVKKGYPKGLTDPTLNVRLLEARRIAAERETDLLSIVGRLVHERDADNDERITDLIQDPNFPVADQHAYHILRRAFEAYPGQVTSALLQRLANGLDLSHGVANLLENAAPVDDGPIVDAVADNTVPQRNAQAAYSVLGPIAVGRFMDQLFHLGQRFERPGYSIGEEERKEYQRLCDVISGSRIGSFVDAISDRAVTDQPRRIRLMADLCASHGRPVNGGSLDVSQEQRDQLVLIIVRWMDVVLTSPDANRHQFSHVACAAERLGDLQFVPRLKKMLERDLSDWTRAREEHAKAKRGGIMTSDVTHSYTLQYRRAFTAIGGSEVFSLMKEYLPNNQFGLDAACVLVDIWRRENPSGQERQFGLWHDFSDVKAHRKRRQDGKEPPTCNFSEAIFDVVQELGTPEHSDAVQRHALGLAAVGLGIPHGSKRTIIDRLLALPQPYAVKRGLLTAAAIAGEVLPAEVLLAGTNELLDAARSEIWRLDQNSGELMRWIELFAFADRPEAALEALELAPDHLRHPWQLRRLLSSLANSPSDGTMGVILALAERDPRFLDEHEWWSAFTQVGTATEESSNTALDIVCKLNVNGRAKGTDAWQLSESLAEAADRFPAFRNAMVARYERIGVGWSRDVLESAVAKVADESIIPVLVRSYASANRPYGGNLAQAIENVAVSRRTARDFPGAFEVFSVSLVALRKALFGMITERTAEAGLAEACLTEIDEQRAVYGRVENEPRHPDIVTGEAWPLAARGLREEHNADPI